MSRLDPLLKTLSQAPATQLPPDICAKIKYLIGGTDPIVATELKDILAECETKNLGTEFARNIISEAIIVAETHN